MSWILPLRPHDPHGIGGIGGGIGPYREQQGTRQPQLPEGSILDKARARLDWVESELERIEGLKAEGEQLRRMIAAAEQPP